MRLYSSLPYNHHMVRKRRKSSRVTIKGARGKKVDDKNVAININNNFNNNNKDQKKKKENTSNSRDKNLGLSDIVETQRSKEETGEQTQMEKQKEDQEKITTHAIATTTHSIPEVFDSSKYDAMTQMKESSNINEEELKEISSNIEKVKPIKPDDDNINNKDLSTDIEINPSLQSESSSLSTVDPSIEERAAMRRGSKKEMISNDQSLVDNKNIASRKDWKNEESTKEQQQEYNSLNILTSSYVNLWRDYVNVWIGMYTESFRNVANLNEY